MSKEAKLCQKGANRRNQRRAILDLSVVVRRDSWRLDIAVLGDAFGHGSFVLGQTAETDMGGIAALFVAVG